MEKNLTPTLHHTHKNNFGCYIYIYINRTKAEPTQRDLSGHSKEKGKINSDSLQYSETQISNKYPQNKSTILNEILCKQIFDNNEIQLLTEHKKYTQELTKIMLEDQFKLR